MVATLFWTLVAYLCGSVPYGLIVGRRYEVDIRQHGSGNIGFANVYRTLGKRPAFVVLAADIMKGLLPALAAGYFLPLPAATVAASAAIIGHVFPVWLKGRGGKGVATALGVSLALYPLVAVISLLVYLVVLLARRVFPLASLMAALSLPVASFFFARQAIAWFSLLTFFAFWTHRSNIRTVRVI